jgi:hypothetical protein
VHQIDLVYTAQLTAAARRLAAPADIVRALSVGWRPVTARVCGVVLPGLLAPPGSGLCGRWAFCVAGYRGEGRPSIAGWAWR